MEPDKGMFDAEDFFDEPTVEMVDAARIDLLKEWHDISENSSTLSALEVHQMHMLALMSDLVYWTWRRGGEPAPKLRAATLFEGVKDVV